MKKIIEQLILLGFLIFFLGGFLLVACQLIGLVLRNNELVMNAKNWFSWIFPAAALTGFACYLYSYIAEK